MILIKKKKALQTATERFLSFGVTTHCHELTYTLCYGFKTWERSMGIFINDPLHPFAFRSLFPDLCGLIFLWNVLFALLCRRILRCTFLIHYFTVSGTFQQHLTRYWLSHRYFCWFQHSHFALSLVDGHCDADPLTFRIISRSYIRDHRRLFTGSRLTGLAWESYPQKCSQSGDSQLVEDQENQLLRQSSSHTGLKPRLFKDSFKPFGMVKACLLFPTLFL